MGWQDAQILTPAPRRTWRDAQVVQESPIGKGESAGRGAAQGFTAKFGDEITGAIQAAPRSALAVSPAGFLFESMRRLADATSGVPESQLEHARQIDAEKAAQADAPGFFPRYRAERDAERAANERARAANPKAYTTGEIGGAILGTPVPGGGLVKAMATGAGMGAASGLGGSTADLTKGDVGGAVEDVLKGTAAGAAGGGLGYGLGKALGAVASPVLRKSAEALERLGLRKGREVLTGRALAGQHRLAMEKELPDRVVQRALDEEAIRPFSTTEAAAERLAGLREEAGDSLQKLVQELEQAGVEGPSAHRMAAELFLRAKDVEANTVASAAPKYLRRIANDLADKFLPGQKIPLSKAEALKRSLQEAARNEYKRLLGNTELGAAKMEGAAKLRAGVEEAVEAGTQAAPATSRVAQLGRAFIPAKQRTGDLIQASDAALLGARRGSLTPEDSLLGTVAGVATGDPATALAAALGKSVARTRGPSTAATAAYGGSKLLRSLARENPAIRDLIQRLPVAIQSAWLDRWARATPAEKEALLEVLRGSNAP